MLRVEDFLEKVKANSGEAFCRAHRHPVLIHCSVTGGLSPASIDGATLDRIVVGSGLEDTTLPGAEDAIDERPVDNLYAIFVLRMNRGRPTSIGSDRRADVRIDDQSVSAFHALCEQRRNAVTIRDNSSSAGTQVNDRLLLAGKATVLEPADRVTLGYVDLIFMPPLHFYHFLRRQLTGGQ